MPPFPSLAAHMPDSSPQQPSFRPPWSAPHTVRLKSPDAYTAHSSSNANNTSRHRPLGQTYWDGGRKSGTYGISGATWQHPDDADEDEDENDTGKLQDSRKQWERTKEEVEAKGGVDAILKDPSTVLTVRDVKKAVPK